MVICCCCCWCIQVEPGCVTPLALANTESCKHVLLLIDSKLQAASQKFFVHPIVNSASVLIDCAGLDKFLRCVTGDRTSSNAGHPTCNSSVSPCLLQIIAGMVYKQQGYGYTSTLHRHDQPGVASAVHITRWQRFAT